MANLNVLIMVGLTALSGCLGCSKVSPGRSVDPDLSVYVERFEALWGEEIEFSVQFVPKMEGNILGKCKQGLIPNSRAAAVRISAETWAWLDDSLKEQLIFHELGHCALGRGHTTGVTADGAPVSIMNANQFYEYEENRAYYINELLGGF